MKLNDIVCLFLCLLATSLLTSCQNLTSDPVKIGFVGGLSGRVADLGGAGRNGALLAVEQRNAAGGINGRPIELVVKDDQQNPETAKRVVGELINREIELIIGPMTSSIAMTVLPQVNASTSILLSPTATSNELSGKDDNFLRVISETTGYASKSARYQYEKIGARTVAAIYDTGNRSYTENWLHEFQKTFSELGGKIILTKGFQSGNDVVFQPLVKELLAAEADLVLVISNVVDSALICQQVRKLAPKQHIAMAEWASTNRFIELAGTAAEGVVVAQFLDRNDASPRYQNFLAAYRQRFQQEPGFAGLAGYDAALVAIEAYLERKPGESLKKVILARGRFQGTQQLLLIDRFGDSDRKDFITVVRNNSYVTVE